MMLSVSATFATDNDDVVAVDDGITEDTLTTDVVDDSDKLSDGESKVVTKDNFGEYFDISTGTLISDADELVFEGDFSDVGVNAIVIAGDKPVKFTGHDATFKNVQFQIMQSGVSIDGFNLVTDESNQNSRLIWIVGYDGINNIVLTNNNINFIAPKGDDAFVIFAGAEEAMGSSVVKGLDIINNTITFVGTDETMKNNVIRVNGNTYDEDYDYVPSELIRVEGNVFDIQMPSIPIDYDPVTYAANPMSEGIVFYYCNDVKFNSNKVNIRYNKVGGSYDTINVIAVYSDMMVSMMEGPCNNIEIVGNNVTGDGHNSIYGIKVSADNFNVSDNKITLTTEEYYANGISVDGPASNGYVQDNTISLLAPSEKATAVYGIYAWGMYGAVEQVKYLNNNIDVEGYLACGMEINQPDAVINDNDIAADGNFTYGIAASIRPVGDVASIVNNTIACCGNNIGFGSGDPILKTGSAGISTLGSAVIEDNKIVSTSVGVICVDDGEIVLSENEINVTAIGNWDNYAVKVTSVESLAMSGNTINFVGTTDGEVVTNGVYIFDTKAEVSENNFNLVIPAADIIYGPAPAYEETLIAEGIVIDMVDNFKFNNNDVEVKYGDIVGYYDTIRALDISNSDNVEISGNYFDITGNNYIYAIKLSGKDFVIYNNTLIVTSESYTNGINIEGVSNGLIDNNRIMLGSKDTAYPIYSGMTGGEPALIITNNDIYGKAYYVVGIEASGYGAEIDHNDIEVEGNHTIGIGTYLNETIITNNNITSRASNVGDAYVWDGMGTNTTGIKVVTGNATIENNNVQTTGDYAVDLCNNNATLTDNYLASKKAVGNDAVSNADNAVITGSGPELKTILSAVDLYTIFGSDDVFYVTLKDENGDPLKNATIVLNYNGELLEVKTDEQGVAAFYVVEELDVGDYPVVISYAGNETYGPKSINALISIAPRPSNIVAPTSASVLLTAIKKGSYYNIVLKDDQGNALVGEGVTITFNGKTAVYTTDASGAIKFKLVATKVGTQKLTVTFDSDPNYIASTLTATIKINKEATKLSAAKKTFKAKVKVKKYTVTLKDSKGKAIKKVKLTLKIKGKTYKATTNAKGKAIFKIKKLTKKGRYTAKVNFAGNGLYNKVAKSVKITVK